MAVAPEAEYDSVCVCVCVCVCIQPIGLPGILFVGAIISIDSILR